MRVDGEEYHRPVHFECDQSHTLMQPVFGFFACEGGGFLGAIGGGFAGTPVAPDPGTIAGTVAVL